MSRLPHELTRSIRCGVAALLLLAAASPARAQGSGASSKRPHVYVVSVIRPESSPAAKAAANVADSIAAVLRSRLRDTTLVVTTARAVDSAGTCAKRPGRCDYLILDQFVDKNLIRSQLLVNPAPARPAPHWDCPIPKEALWCTGLRYAVDKSWERCLRGLVDSLPRKLSDHHQRHHGSASPTPGC
jgi:hypothetical protein